MGLWSRLIRWGRPVEKPPAEATAAEAAPEEGSETPRTITLPNEPFVFECQSCGKVFEARRLRPACPECDSTEVSLLSGE
jgi:Zn finger protein HypA/HybF involved in hydrogenase expression